MKPRCLIVDIDGTVANNHHRAIHVRQKPKNWKLYHQTTHLDLPFHDIIEMVKHLTKDDIELVFCSGRSEDEREVTEKWLREVGTFHEWKALFMRPSKDYRDDSIIKSELLDQILVTWNVWMAIDDRDRVVNMWRERGIRCLQVAPGAF